MQLFALGNLTYQTSVVTSVRNAALLLVQPELHSTVSVLHMYPVCADVQHVHTVRSAQTDAVSCATQHSTA
jgi:hypothetical protein